MGCAPQ